MKPNTLKPVSAQTAGAMDTLNVSESHNVQQVNKNSDGHYIGDNNERLFTSDEVNTLIRERLDRQLKTLLSKYEISSKEELDSLVSLAKKMNEVYKNFNSSNKNNIERKTKQMEQQPSNNSGATTIVDVIKILKGREYCSISFLQRSLAVGFTRAGHYFNTLVKANVIDSNGNSKGCKVHQDELEKYLDLSLEEIEKKLHQSTQEYRIKNHIVRNYLQDLSTYKDFIRIMNIENVEFKIEIEKCILLCGHLLSEFDDKSDKEYEKLETDYNNIKRKMSELIQK